MRHLYYIFSECRGAEVEVINTDIRKVEADEVDVLLTPLKPSRKNVTEQDVASSLYFLHYNTEAERQALQTANANSNRERLPQRALSRKAVASASPSFQGKRQSISPDASERLTRKPLPVLSHETSPALGEQIPSLKSEFSEAESLPVVSSGDHCQTDNLERRPARPPRFPGVERADSQIKRKALPNLPQITTDLLSAENHPPVRLPASHSNTNLSPIAPQSAISTSTKFSITVIRRDPASGAQWNVGEISTRDDSLIVDGMKAAVDVCITAPGYTKFRGAAPDSRNIDSDLLSNGVLHDETTSFARSLCRKQDRSNSWDKRIANLRRLPDAGLEKSSGQRNSIDSGLATANTPRDGFKSSPRALRDKGYAFLSPWNGRCQFKTGLDGKSLKCRHTLPIPIGASETAKDRAIEAAVISELRFNLPTTQMFGATPQTFGLDAKRFKTPKLSGIRYRISQQDYNIASWREALNEMFESSDDEDEEERLDLSLGQEKAGGGKGGKRAKLGKLVVHDEGLKMLDLVVAANMGVWWLVYERD